jgi:N-acetylglucosamine kinase-like BadF-type ATPase
MVGRMKNVHLDDRDIATLSKALKQYAESGESEAVERILAKIAEATDDEITEATLLIG